MAQICEDTRPYILIHCEVYIHDRNINEPILERGMMSLINKYEIFSKLANFSAPDPKISAIFMIFEVFSAFRGLGRAIFVVFQNIIFISCISLVIPLSKMGSLIFSS